MKYIKYAEIYGNIWKYLKTCRNIWKYMENIVITIIMTKITTYLEIVGGLQDGCGFGWVKAC